MSDTKVRYYILLSWIWEALFYRFMKICSFMALYFYDRLSDKDIAQGAGIQWNERPGVTQSAEGTRRKEYKTENQYSC